MSCLVEFTKNLEIRGSNPGPGSNFSLENLISNVVLRKENLELDMHRMILPNGKLFSIRITHNQIMFRQCSFSIGNLKLDRHCIVLYCIVFDGVVITVQCTATF